MLGRDIVEVGEERRRGPAHILVVDDEPHIRRLLEVNLQRACYRVTAVDRIAAAREVINSDRPDVIILDIWVPADENAVPRDRISSFDFSRELREDPTTATVPVILMPVKTADADVYRNETLPMLTRENRPHLYKPFNPMEVLTLVKKILDKVRDPEGRSRPRPGSRIF